MLKRQRDEALKKIGLLEKTLSQVRLETRNCQSVQEQSAKNLKNKLDKAKQQLEENESSSDELKKLRKQVSTYKCQIAKLESAERKLKTMLLEKESEIEGDRVEFRRKLNAEKKRIMSQNEETVRQKEELERKRIKLVQEMSIKDEKISHLKWRLQQCAPGQSSNLEASLSGGANYSKIAKSSLGNYSAGKNCTLAQHPAFTDSARGSKKKQTKLASSKSQGKLQQAEKIAKYEGIIMAGGFANTETLPVAEYKLLKTCQIMVDTASMMECRICSIVLDVEAFHDHVVLKKCLGKQLSPRSLQAQSCGIFLKPGQQSLFGGRNSVLSQGYSECEQSSSLFKPSKSKNTLFL